MKFLSIIITIIVLSACSNTKKTSENITVREVYPQGILTPRLEANETNSPFKIDKVEFERNYIVIHFKHPDADLNAIELWGSTMLMKSKPPIRNIALIYTKEIDKTKKLMKGKVKFSISNFAEHTNPGNLIKLKLYGYEEYLEYSYQ